MTVYVDQSIYKKPNGKVLYCHMIADTLVELHEFATKIEISSAWFHSGRFKHYDLNPVNRLAAVDAGAVEITSKEMVTLLKKLVLPSTTHI